MGLYNLPDALGHSLTSTPKDPSATYNRVYQCTCGQWLWAYKKSDGNADRRTFRMWADHIELANLTADYIVELGTVQLAKSVHTYYLFTTKHPRFGDWEAPSGWMKRRHQAHVDGTSNPEYVVGVEKTRMKGPSKKIIHYFYDAKASAIAGAYKQLDAADHQGRATTRTEECSGAGLPSSININTISLVDAASDLISRGDEAILAEDLSTLIDVQTEIRNFLTMEGLLRHKVAEIDTEINRVGLGRQIA